MKKIVKLQNELIMVLLITMFESGHEPNLGITGRIKKINELIAGKSNELKSLEINY
jgi:hypothetical protein